MYQTTRIYSFNIYKFLEIICNLELQLLKLSSSAYIYLQKFFFYISVPTVIQENDLEFMQNSPAKKTRIYRNVMELFFLEPQSIFQLAVAEFFFSVFCAILQIHFTVLKSISFLNGHYNLESTYWIAFGQSCTLSINFICAIHKYKFSVDFFIRK